MIKVQVCPTIHPHTQMFLHTRYCSLLSYTKKKKIKSEGDLTTFHRCHLYLKRYIRMGSERKKENAHLWGDSKAFNLEYFILQNWREELNFHEERNLNISTSFPLFPLEKGLHVVVAQEDQSFFFVKYALVVFLNFQFSGLNFCHFFWVFLDDKQFLTRETFLTFT